MTRWQLILIPLFAAVGICGGVSVLLLTVFNYFVIPISQDLGLQSQEVSAALSFHLIALIVALPFAGALADRIGPRLVICSSALLFGACLLAISMIQANKVTLYAAFAAAGIAGAGTSPVSYAKTIVSRFDRRRGLALGIALTGTGVASIVLPPLLREVVVEQGWRAGFVVLASIAAACGLIGGIASDAGRGVDSTPAMVGDRTALRRDTLHAAIARPVFWMMGLALFLHGLVLVGIVAHLTEAWQAFGWPTSAVPAFQAVLGLSAIVGRIGGGALMDRIRPNLIGAAAGVAGAAGLMILLVHSDGPSAPIVAAVLLGLCSGAESDVASLLSSRYFGLTRFAEIYALQAGAFMVGAALGPYVCAHLAERSDYRFAFLAALAGFLASAALLAALPKTRSPTTTSISFST